MKFTINRDVLKGELVRLKETVDKGNLPVIKSIKFNLAGNELVLQSTNMDLLTIVSLQVEGLQDGYVCIDYKYLSNLIDKKFKKDELITIELEGFKVSFKSDKKEFLFDGLDSGEYPVFDYGDIKEDFNIDIEIFLHAINKVSFAMSKEEVRFYLCGIHLHNDDGKLNFVATKGHVLSIYPIDKDVLKGVENLLLPSNAVNTFQKLAKKETGVLKFSLYERFIVLEYGNYKLVIKLINGVAYPDYKRVIPNKELASKITFKTSELDSAREIVDLNLEKRFDIIPMKLFIDGNKCVCHSRDKKFGEAKTEVAIINHDNLETSIGFSPLYLKEVLGILEGEIDMYIIEPSDPFILEGGNSLNVLMPIRIK